jgi:hypothetical protein
MLVAPILHVSSSLSLAIVFGVLLASIAASFLTRKKDKVLD